MPGMKKDYKDTWRPKSKASEGPKKSMPRNVKKAVSKKPMPRKMK